MAVPSSKSHDLTKFLDSISNRTEAIKSDICLAPPMGCGAAATEFDDELSRKYYTISGFCQKCQDRIFAEPDD